MNEKQKRDFERKKEANISRVHSLIAKASESSDSNDALKYSQAALNAANALSTLTGVY